MTFLNFPFIWNQVKRYKSYVLLLPVVMIGMYLFFVNTQYTIYRQYLNLKVSGEVIPGEFSRNQLVLSYDELYASTMSNDFFAYLSHLVVASPHFREMTFTPLKAKSLRSWKTVFGSCHGEKLCEERAFAGVIGQFVDIKKGISNDRFVFELSSLDADTLKYLSPIFMSAVEKFRVLSIQSVYRKQEKSVQEMLEKSRRDLDSKGGLEAMNKFKSNELRLQELKESISNLQRSIAEESSLLSTMGFKLRETYDLAQGMNVGESEKVKAEKFRTKTAKMNELRQNIAALNSLAVGERSPSDEIVLTKIQTELREVEQELKTISSSTVRYSERESFNSTQQSNKNSLDFDVKVLRKKISQEKVQLQALMTEGQRLISENSKLETDSLSLKQDIESIKVLESRLMTIKLMIATAEADILFEGASDGLDEFNRSTRGQNLVFSFVIAFLVFFIVLLTRYFFDDRIYEEHEVRKCFKDLPIIGKTPDFD